MSRPQTASTRKHVLFCYAEEDEFCLKEVIKLRQEFTQNRLRVYNPKNKNDVNVMISDGVENANLLICFPSIYMQKSKIVSKIMNYADQENPDFNNNYQKL